MGDGGITAPRQTFTQVFDAVFPVYLSMGMPYELFWNGDPKLAIAYRKADKFNRQRMNEELWLQGIYVAEALNATVGNMFSKGEKHKYPTEPIPITEQEIEERKERARKAKMEQIKARFTAKALTINAKLGGEKT